VTLTAWGAEKLGLEEITMDPLHDEKSLARLGQANWRGLADALHATTPGNPVITYDCLINYEGGGRWTRIVARATWSAVSSSPRTKRDVTRSSSSTATGREYTPLLTWKPSA